ncbi:ImmA/IrrE family metallo-endopeptidase [Aeribacillus sp. FSL K6-1121]|uniref:ImmA/IrrE family metallo-endopeptidase n=1 Tax=Aeribacillus sp. FSL K6-1121 TaxID=2954745 RepID=UPI0030F93AEF
MKFRIGCVNYEVKEVDELREKYSLYGQVTYDDCTIEIDADLSKERKHNVIAHELLHAMFFEAGYDEHDEDLIRRVGNVLAQVLRDNDFGFMRTEESE